MARNYSNVAEETTLSTGINSSATSITVGSNTGYPSVPYTIIIDPGLATEEVCEVTAVVGTTWTITRGVDGTPASSHDSAAVVVHGYSARDLRDIQDHIDDTTGVHGLASSSAVVGTTDTQTLTGKTLTSPTINGGTINSVTFGSGLTFTSPILTTPTIADFTNATHTHEDAASGGSLGGGSSTSVAYKRTGSGSVNLDADESSTSGTAISFSTLAYSVGNDTWATASSNSRILLPTDIATGYWALSVGMRFSGAGESPYILVVHETLGTIAQDAKFLAAEEVGALFLSTSVDFMSAAGKWIEVRAGSSSQNLGSVGYSTAHLSLHRIA